MFDKSEGKHDRMINIHDDHLQFGVLIIKNAFSFVKPTICKPTEIHPFKCALISFILLVFYSNVCVRNLKLYLGIFSTYSIPSIIFIE